MGKVVYFGQAGLGGSERIISSASNTLISYVTNAIAPMRNLLVLSSACSSGDNPCKETHELSNGVAVTYLPLSMNKGASLLKRVLTKHKNKKELYKGLLDAVQDGDTLIVYHSLSYIKELKALRKKRKFTLILQVCEIYSDVTEDKKSRKAEIDFIHTADKYIFSSQLLNSELNTENKPYVICMGTYETAEQIVAPKQDGKTHLVYAGTFNPIKGGVFSAIACTEFLDENYHLHILGGGEDMLVKSVIKEIILASTKTACEISYEGYLVGEEYKRLLQSCHIGLSTQDGSKAYSNTSFPSKILVYMANGLRVVSGKIPAVTTSDIDGEMFYYEHQAPRMIASAIKAATQAQKTDSRMALKRLDAEFQKSILSLIEEEK